MNFNLFLDMNLIIDCGNTNLKYCFQRQYIIIQNRFRWEDEWESMIKKKFSVIKNILLSDVTGNYNKVDLEKTSDKNIYEVKASNLPFESNYNYKDLGDDRIGLIAAAIDNILKTIVLEIDAFGSRLTFDLVSSKSVHEGGLISPGLLIRYKSLNKYTSSLHTN